MGTPIVTTPTVPAENGSIPAVSTVPAAPFDALMALLVPAPTDLATATPVPADAVIDPTIAVPPAAATAATTVVEGLQTPAMTALTPVSQPMVNGAMAPSPDADLLDMLAASALASRRVVARSTLEPEPKQPDGIAPEDFIGPVLPTATAGVDAGQASSPEAFAAMSVSEDFIGPVLPPERRLVPVALMGAEIEVDLAAMPPLAPSDPAQTLPASQTASSNVAPQLSDAGEPLQPISEVQEAEQPKPQDMAALLQVNEDVSLEPVSSVFRTVAGAQDMAASPSGTVIQSLKTADHDAHRTAMVSEKIRASGLNVKPVQATVSASSAVAMAADDRHVAEESAAALNVHPSENRVAATLSKTDALEESDGGTGNAASFASLSTRDAAILMALQPGEPHRASRDEEIDDAANPALMAQSSRVITVKNVDEYAQKNVANTASHNAPTERRLTPEAHANTILSARDISVAAQAHGHAGGDTDARGQRNNPNSAQSVDGASGQANVPVDETSDRAAIHARAPLQNAVSGRGTPLDVLARTQPNDSAHAASVQSVEIDPKLTAMVQSISVTGDTNQASVVTAAPITDTSPTIRAEAAAREAPTVSAVTADGRRDTQRDAEIRERQIKQQVTMALRAGSQEVRMQLYPPGLGQVMIRLALDGQKLRLSIKSESTEATDALLQAEGGLRDALSRDGFNLAGFDVHDDERRQNRSQPEPQPVSTTNTGSGEAFSVDMTA